MNRRVSILVQARMGSTRLPGKTLLPVLGRPLLEYHVERLQRARRADDVIVATTTSAADDAIEAWAARRGVACFRGSEDDVLGRYIDCAKKYGSDVVVRTTADCPLIDPELVDTTIEAVLRPGVTYAAVNLIDRTYPRGLDVEAVLFQALEESARETSLPSDREHVTEFVLARPQRYPSVSLRYTDDLGALRWTVDTAEDFELVRRILEELYPAKPAFTWMDVLELVRRHPDWGDLNAHVRQKA